MEQDIGGELFGKDGRGGEVPRNNNALASVEVLDKDFMGGKGLEFRSEFLHAKRSEPFSFGWASSCEGYKRRNGVPLRRILAMNEENGNTRRARSLGNKSKLAGVLAMSRLARITSTL